MAKITQIAGRNALGTFAPDFAHFNDDILFGENWNNEDIDLKTRSIITVVALMAQGITDSSLKFHLQNAKDHGVRPQWKSESLRGTTDRVAMGKYDKTEAEDMQIVKRVAELAEKYNCKMSQIAIAWQWAKGILSPIIGATKTQYLDDSAGAFDIKLTAEDLAYLEEPYVPHEIVGAIDKNPAQGVILLDEKK